jgi:predicted kinase
MKTLVIFSGLPGTGKSTLAMRLARELKVPLLSIDDVTGEIPENAGFSFWDSRISILLDLIETQLEVGLDVVVDSVFMNTDRQHAQDLAHRYNARFRPVYVYVSDEKIWQERVTARFNSLSNPDVAAWERIQHQRLHFREWDPGTALFVDSIQPVDRNHQTVLNFVTKETVNLKPLAIPLTEGKYHE